MKVPKQHALKSTVVEIFPFTNGTNLRRSDVKIVILVSITQNVFRGGRQSPPPLLYFFCYIQTILPPDLKLRAIVWFSG